MRYGYVRARSLDGIESQVNKLVEYGIEEFIIEDAASAEKLKDFAFAHFCPEDELYITSWDRLSRSPSDVARILKLLAGYGVELYVDGRKYDMAKFVAQSLIIDALLADR